MFERKPRRKLMKAFPIPHSQGRKLILLYDAPPARQKAALRFIRETLEAKR